MTDVQKHIVEQLQAVEGISYTANNDGTVTVRADGGGQAIIVSDPPRANGYKTQADAYREYLAAHACDGPVKETLERDIRIYDFLATCAEPDIRALYDTGAFNGIIAAYCRAAARDAGLTDEQTDALMDALRWLIDTRTSVDV